MRRLIHIALAAALTVAGCSRAADPELEGSYSPEPETPAPVYDFTPELADATPRAAGMADGTALRLDKPGTLVMTTGEHAYAYVDLDTSRDIRFSFTGIAGDGSLAGVSLSAGATAVSVASARLVKTAADGTGWIHVVTADGANVVIVTPPAD